MEVIYGNYEYNNIVKEILDNKEFQKLENYRHHTTNRLEHCMRVSYLSYRICKRLHLDYVSASRGGLLHDFFTESYSPNERTKLLVNHPLLALANARKYFSLNKVEENIIASHMFPINIKVLPKYPESIIITTVDKFACIYEKTRGYKSVFDFKLGSLLIYIFLMITSS